MKKRVLFVTYVYEKGGGTEKHLEELIVRLDLSKVDPVILCFGPDVYTARLHQKHGLDVKIRHGLKGNTFLAYWLSFIRLRPHVVVFVNGNLGCFPWHAYVAARCSTAKRVFAIEHLIAEPFSLRETGRGRLSALRRLAGWRARYLWKFNMEGILCDQVICVSQAVSDRLISDYEFPKRKTMVVRNGVDLDHYGFSRNGKRAGDGDLRVDSPGFNVLCVARLSLPKGIDILLDAMCKVLSECPSCKCTIVGDGPLKGKLAEKALALGISRSIHFAGHVEEVRPYYEDADIFILSSLKEGLPFVLLEAMAYGIPCVATRVGGNAEVIVHGQTGLVVEPENPEELAKAILSLLADPELRRDMGMKGKERVARYFNLDHTVAKLTEVILN